MGQLSRIRHLLRDAVAVVLRPYWKLHVPLAVAILAVVSFETFFPLTIRFLIDDALIPHDLHKLVMALGVLVVLFALAAAARFVLAIIRGYMNAELNKDFRIHLINIMKRLPMSYFDHAQPAQFSPLFDTELVTYSRMCRDLFTRGFHSVVQLLVILGTMALLNWQLALMVLILLPLIVLPPHRRLDGTVDAIDRIRKTIERVNSAVQDYVATQALIRAFGLGERASKRFIDEVIGRKGQRISLTSAADLRRTLKIPHFVMQTVRISLDNQQALITLLVVGAGAGLNFVGGLSLGTFSAFILFLPVVMRTITELADFVQDLGRATLSRERFLAVEKATRPQASGAAMRALPAPHQSIEFDDVSFSYTEDTPYIQHLDLTLPVGESIALVGRSGAGKSTLFKLLLGFYRPTSGRVKIDGYDLCHVDPASLGARIGTVLQGSILTNSTIRENICFAKADASDEALQTAAKMAGMHDFIMTLPDGYESGVGEGGRWLSEGQRQRIALARAILADPSILLLDEVTASLDPENESAIIATIQQLAMDRTVIIVTHRLASTAFVDRVIVVDQGQVKEQGGHEELLARQGLYHQLWQMQTGFVVSADGHHAQVQGERLQVIPLFRDVDIETLEGLAGQFVSEFHQPGHVLYEEGELGDRFYIVVRGIVSVSSLGAGRTPIRLADLQDGDYFGEVEMLNRGRRATTVTAKTPSLVLTLQAEHFRAMVDDLSSLNKVVTQMALGRSLSTICSVGRRRRTDPVFRLLMET